METLTIQGAVERTEEGATLCLTVRNCDVVAIFPPQTNSAVYQRIKRVLMESCLSDFYAADCAKIGQNT